MNNLKRSGVSKGIVALFFATFLFSLFGVFTRLIADQVGVFFQLLVRVSIMCGIFFAIGRLTHSFKKIKGNDFKLFILRGILVVVDFTSFYIAITQLPLGLTLFIFYAASVAANFLYGYLFLHEEITSIKVISLFLALLGLVAIYGDSFGSLKLIPALAAIFSGACFGLTTSTSKTLTDKYSVTQVNFVAYLTAAILAIPLLIIVQEDISFNIPISTILLLILFSITGVGAFYATLYGYKFLEAQKASLIMLAELIFVVLLGFVLYKELPNINTIIGGILILSALALPNLPHNKTFKIN